MPVESWKSAGLMNRSLVTVTPYGNAAGAMPSAAVSNHQALPCQEPPSEVPAQLLPAGTVRRRRGPEPEMRAGSGPFTEGGQPCLQWFAKHMSGLVCRLWNPDPMTLALGNVGDIREGSVVGPLVGVYELLRSMYRSAYPWTVTTKAETRGAGPGLLSGSSTARMRASMVSGVVEWWWPGWKGRLRRQ
ncbi:hypothetical protein Purlil1_10006 [Purpureocillium lilacinum]|uniref:Uncharacterized protein n=1 Tax=Purpureocillium lilacinum TaxID=33203 RepID=A0ABR0BNR1_PURLI|nr:hypothetical protein Purlil1_10006 [Purpureocillium lilacinum]